MPRLGREPRKVWPEPKKIRPLFGSGHTKILSVSAEIRLKAKVADKILAIQSMKIRSFLQTVQHLKIL